MDPPIRSTTQVVFNARPHLLPAKHPRLLLVPRLQRRLSRPRPHRPPHLRLLRPLRPMDFNRDKPGVIQHGYDYGLCPTFTMYWRADHTNGMARDQFVGERHQPGCHFYHNHLLSEPILL